jgi:Flp pilus assembly protein TadG
MFRAFAHQTRASVSTVFALSVVPVILATGGAVDYMRAYQQKAIVQDALDSAALAAGREIGTLTETQVKARAQEYFLANLAGKVEPAPPLSTAITAATVTTRAKLEVETAFLGLVGLDKITFDLMSQVTSGIGTLEVVMALDNSGSMSGTKIATLKTAATDLATTLFGLAATSTKPDPIRVGIVPFAAAVNVGPGYANAAWMDTSAVGPQHGDAMDGDANKVNNFELLAALKNQSWAGCVEERPIPYDVSDATPERSKPGTMFVPMFAPDEPDNWTCTRSTCSSTGSGSKRAYSGAPSGSQSYNNYIKDNGGDCSGSTDTAFTGSANEEQAFKRTCKYRNATPAAITVNGYPGGPNYMCTTKPLTPLTTSKTAVLSAISAMAANGMTNIHSGLVWGWHLLSPGEPFVQGRSYDDDENLKILVLMTDGENTYNTDSEVFLKSDYSAWGYVAMNHLGTTNTSQVVKKMNERTALACANIKAAGIKIYTIAFQVSDSTTLAMLRDCASEPAMAFQSTSTTALLAAFKAIGDEISQLRISL